MKTIKHLLMITSLLFFSFSGMSQNVDMHSDAPHHVPEDFRNEVRKWRESLCKVMPFNAKSHAEANMHLNRGFCVSSESLKTICDDFLQHIPINCANSRALEIISVMAAHFGELSEEHRALWLLVMPELFILNFPLSRNDQILDFPEKVRQAILRNLLEALLEGPLLMANVFYFSPQTNMKAVCQILNAGLNLNEKIPLLNAGERFGERLKIVFNCEFNGLVNSCINQLHDVSENVLGAAIMASVNRKKWDCFLRLVTTESGSALLKKLLQNDQTIIYEAAKNLVDLCELHDNGQFDFSTDDEIEEIFAQNIDIQRLVELIRLLVKNGAVVDEMTLESLIGETGKGPDESLEEFLTEKLKQLLVCDDSKNVPPPRHDRFKF